jgi:hypothetical protein
VSMYLLAAFAASNNWICECAIDRLNIDISDKRTSCEIPQKHIADYEAKNATQMQMQMQRVGKGRKSRVTRVPKRKSSSQAQKENLISIHTQAIPVAIPTPFVLSPSSLHEYQLRLQNILLLLRRPQRRLLRGVRFILFPHHTRPLKARFFHRGSCTDPRGGLFISSRFGRRLCTRRYFGG